MAARRLVRRARPFVRRQLVLLIVDFGERLARTLDEAPPEVLVRQEPSDHELRGPVRRGRIPKAISTPALFTPHGGESVRARFGACALMRMCDRR